MTKLLGVIGDPIAHSMSPLIHNGWLRDLGYNANYEAMHVPAGEFDLALQTLETRDILGVNVTLPHKADALRAATTKHPAAAAIGAANTLSFQSDGNWTADNTDAPGFLRAIGEIDPSTDKVIILGAGGSARALVYALSKAGFSPIILNRTIAKAQALAGDLGGTKSLGASLDQYKDYLDSATIVINTTSMGHEGAVLELPEGRDRLFFDISYGHISAAQLAHAAARGWRNRDGLTMLVAQAAYSFEIWFNEFPSIDAGLRRCRAAMKAIT